MSTRAKAPRLRRTWPQRLLICLNVICIVAALAGAGSLAYAKREVGKIDRVVIDANGFASSTGMKGDQPRNFLIVGADSDSGLDANDPAKAGRASVGGVRSDTIMIVRIDPKAKRAKVLSFPRDLWVNIPGNSPGRINSSLQFGGPELLISTIKANFDIDVNHYVQIDFAGFESLVRLLGGIPVYFATPVRDQGGLNVENAGCNTLDPNGALAYVRARHLRYQNENGRWVSDPTSDLGRISRQQEFIKRVLRRAIKQGARNPVKLGDFINVGVQNITLDKNTTPGDLADLGVTFKNFDPNTLETYSLPVTDVYRGGAAVLDLVDAKAELILALFRGTGTPAEGGISPATVAAQVLNGSGKQDQASDASAVLATAGFKMTPPSSAPAVERTEVRYTPGMEAQAALVARHLFANAVLIPDIDVSKITVITGPEFVSALLEPRAEADVPVPTTTTTTTVPGSTVPGASTTGGPSTTAATTTTTAPVGYLPANPPAGETCG